MKRTRSGKSVASDKQIDKSGADDEYESDYNPRTSREEVRMELKRELPKIQVFDPTSMVEYPSIIIFGRRRGGKSVLARELMQQWEEKFDDAYLFSTTGPFQPWFWDCFDPEKIINCNDGFRDDVLKSIIDRQYEEKMLLMEKHKKCKDKEKLEKLIKGEQRQVLICLDDVVQDSMVQRSSNVSTLFNLGRHLGFTVMVLSQSVNKSSSVGQLARQNVDYVFTTLMQSQENYETLGRIYFARKGYRLGMKFVEEVTKEAHSFAVGELHLKEGRELSEYCRVFKPKDPLDNNKPFVLEKKKRKHQEERSVDLGKYGIHSESVKQIKRPRNNLIVPVRVNAFALS